MKSLLLVVLLAAAASAAFVSHDVVEAPDMIVTHEEVDPTDVADVQPQTEVDFSEGDSRSGRLLARSVHIRGAAFNVIHVQDITFRTNGFRITAFRAVQVGTPQGAQASLRAGGLNNNFVTIRLQSARSRGYHYQIEIYGR